MVSSVDERIVAAKFDSSDFEKGVDKTIKKLDELKKSFDLKETTKSVKDLADKTESSTKSIGKSLDTLTDRLTTFTGMIKQRILGGLADEVAGVFLKMEQSIKNFVTGISTQQISAGMGKYEAMLTAVRVMMSSGQTEEDAYEAIGVLRDYSDQTSYSLSQMSDALSKLVASGSDLDTATKAVQGIANACASAGVNATDAARAYYNLAQAYSKGNLQYTDYKSLELLNMTNVNFKEQLLEAAAAAGTLEKTMKKVKQADGTFKETAIYKTTNKKDKKVKGGKAVDVNNLSEMLKYDFVNNEVMNKLFGENFYFGEKEWKEILKKNKGDREAAYNEAIKQYGKIAVEAYHAAREARNFTDVINTIKDVVSTGWSTTFEHLFGRLEQAKEFFTSLAEGELADVVYKIGEYRNAILGYWNALDIEGNGTGGVLLRQTILNLSDALGTLFKTFLSILPGFEELDNTEEEGQATLKSLGENLKLFTARVRDASISFKEAMEKFSKWMHSPMFENGPTRIEAIRSALSNLLSVVGIAGRLLGIAFSALGKVFTVLSPVFDGFLIFLDKVTGPLKDLKKNDDAFKNIEYTIGNILTILTPIANVLGKVVGFLGEIGAFFVDMAISTFTMNLEFFSDVLGLVLELLTGHSMQELDEKGISVLGKLNKSFTEIKDACTEALGALKEFFSSVIEDLKVLFGLAEPAEGEEGGFFANLKNFFDTNEFVQSAKAWVDQAIIDVGDFIKSIPERVKKFGENIYNTLYSLFFYEETKYNGSMLETRTYKTELYKWLEQAIEDIKNFIISIPDRIIKGVGTVASWINVVFDKLLGTGESTENKDTSEAKEKAADGVKTSFDDFIDNVTTSIKEWFDDLPNKIQAAFAGVGDFVSRLYNVIDTFVFGRKYSKKTYNLKTRQYEWVESRYKSGFSKWLDGFIEEIKKFIKKIPEYIKLGIKGAGDILNAIVNAIFGVSDSEKNAAASSKELENKLKAPFESVNLTSILDKIKEIGETILNQIIRCFTGTEDIEFNMQWFSDKIAEGITWIKEKAISSWESIKAWFIALPTKIANFFKGENAEKQEEGTIGSAILSFATTIGGFILDLPSTIMGFLTTAISELSGIWDMLYEQVTGTAEEGAEKAASASSESLAPDKKSADTAALKSKWETFIESLGTLVSSVFEKLPTMIAQGLDMAVIEIDKILGSIAEWINADKGEAAGENVVENVADNIEAGSENKEPALLAAIKKIGASLKKLILETLPTFFQSAWAELSKWGSEIWIGFTSIFDQNVTPESGIAKAIHDFGESIKKLILTDIPTALTEAWDSITKFIDGLVNPKETIPKEAFDEDEQLVTETYKQFRNRLKKNIKNVDKKSDDKDVGKSFIDQLIENINNGIKMIGPSLLDAINWVVKALGDVGSLLFDGLMGGTKITDEIDKKYGKDSGISAKLIELGENLKNFFLSTVPKFIGAAIGTLIKEAPNWFAELFGGINSAMAESAEETLGGDNSETGSSGGKQFTEAAETSVNGIIGVIENVLTSPVMHTGAAIIAGLVVLLKIIELVKEIISVMNPTGNLADKAAANNSIEAVFKRALTALIAGIALAAYAGSLDEDKFEHVKTIFESLGSLLTTITAIYGGTQFVTSGIGLAKSVVELKKAKHTALEVVNVAGDYTKVASKGTSILQTGGKALVTAGGTYLMGETISELISQFLGNFGELGSAINAFSGGFSDAVLKLEEAEGKITTAITVLSGAIQICQKAKEIADYYYDVSSAKLTFGELTEGFGTFANSFVGGDTNVDKAVQAVKDILEMQDEMSKFVKFVNDGSTFSEFKHAILTLGAALSTLGGSSLESIGTVNSTAIDNAKRALSSILSDDGLMYLANQLTTDNFGADSADMYEATERLIVFATAIGKLGQSVGTFTAEQGNSIAEFFMAIDKIKLEEFGTSGAVTLGQKMTALSSGLRSFKEATSGINEDEVKTVGIGLEMLAATAERVDKLGHGFLGSLIMGSEDLSTFGNGIGALGANLKSFLDAVDPLDAEGNRIPRSMENMRVAMFAMSELASAAVKISNSKSGVDNLSYLFEKNSVLAANIAGFFIKLQEAEVTFSSTESRKTIRDLNFGLIEQVLESFNSLTSSVSTIGSVRDVKNVLENFGKGLFYEEGDKKKGFLISLVNGIKEVDTILSEGSFNMDNIYDFLISLATFGKSLAQMPPDGGVEGKSRMSYIISAIDQIVDSEDKLSKLFDMADRLKVDERVERTKSIFDSIGAIGRAINAFGFGTDAYNPMSAFTEGLNNLLSSDPELIAQGISTVLQAYATAMSDSDVFNSFDEAGHSISEMIKSSIESAFNDPDSSVQPEITIRPVIHFDQDYLNQQINSELGLGGEYTLDMNALVKSISGLGDQQENGLNEEYFDTKFLSITDAIKDLSDNTAKVSDVSNALGGMTMVLDTGTLAGAMANDIDAIIGDKVWLVMRGNSVYSTTK